MFSFFQHILPKKEEKLDVIICSSLLKGIHAAVAGRDPMRILFTILLALSAHALVLPFSPASAKRTRSATPTLAASEDDEEDCPSDDIINAAYAK